MIYELLSRLGARIGNANDRRGYGRGKDTLHSAGWRWRIIDRLACRLHVLGDHPLAKAWRDRRGEP